MGFVTGARVRVRFRPAPPDTGLVFRRTDRPDRPAIPARVESVTGTRRRTTLGPPAHGVTLVEHLLAALAGLRIDNCAVELDGPEPPGLDGSADGLRRACSPRPGRCSRSGRRPIRTPSTHRSWCRPAARRIGLHPRRERRPCVSATCSTTARRPDPAADVHARRSPRRVRPRGGAVPDVPHRAEAEALQAQGIGKHLTPDRPARVRTPRADRQPAALRRRTGPAQGARPDRRPGAVRVRPGRARGRVPLRARAERGAGPDGWPRRRRRVFKSASLQVVKSTGRPARPVPT